VQEKARETLAKKRGLDGASSLDKK